MKKFSGQFFRWYIDQKKNYQIHFLIWFIYKLIGAGIKKVTCIKPVISELLWMRTLNTNNWRYERMTWWTLYITSFSIWIHENLDSYIIYQFQSKEFWFGRLTFVPDIHQRMCRISREDTLRAAKLLTYKHHQQISVRSKSDRRFNTFHKYWSTAYVEE